MFTESLACARAMPKNIAYRSMILIHKILIFLGFVWAFASLLLFYKYSQFIFANAIVSISSLLGRPDVDLQSLFIYDHLLWQIFLFLLGLLTVYVWKCKVHGGYREKWRKSIWEKKPLLLQAIKKQFEQSKTDV